MSKEVMDLVDECYMCILGFEMTREQKAMALKSRLAEHVRPRSAILVALTTRFSISEVARTLGINHATVIHHRRNHDGNYKHWGGYDVMYITALEVVSRNLLSNRNEQVNFDPAANSCGVLQHEESGPPC